MFALGIEDVDVFRHADIELAGNDVLRAADGQAMRLILERNLGEFPAVGRENGHAAVAADVDPIRVVHSQGPRLAERHGEAGGLVIAHHLGRNRSRLL